MTRNIRNGTRAHGIRASTLPTVVFTVALAVLAAEGVVVGALLSGTITNVAGPETGLSSRGQTPSAGGEFPLTFNETGLPTGSAWNVTLNGTTQSASTGSSITFSEPNGTYAYTLTGSPGYALISPEASGLVTVAGSPNTVMVPAIGVGAQPLGMAYDPANGYLYVANAADDNVSVIDGSTNTIVGSIGVGSAPSGIAYDAANGYLYVANQIDKTVTVVDGESNTVIGENIGVGSAPSGIAYNAANGYLYVANLLSDNVTVIDGASNTVVVPSIGVGSTPAAIAVSPSGTWAYTANYGSDSVSVIDTQRNSVVATVTGPSSPQGVVVSPNGTYVYVTRLAGSTVSVIDAAMNSVVTNISVGSSPSGIAYDAANGYLYVTNQGSGSVSVIDAATNTVVTTIGVGTSPRHVDCNLANGYLYVSNYGSDNVTAVNGNGRFLSYWGLAYSVAFSESGLPNGTEWWVNVTGRTPERSASGLITMSLPNGSYTYTVSAADHAYQASGGTFKVNGAPVSESVTFSLLTYSVTFTQRGLPSGTSWNVTFNGTPRSSSTTSITFTVPDGMYTFAVGAVTGYTVSPSTGSLSLNGAPISVTITFTRVMYTITFVESGLPSGTSWTVTLGGTTVSSATPTITFTDPNGTYRYTVGSISGWTYAYLAWSAPGYSVSPSSGSVVVPTTRSVAITFTKASPSISVWVWEIVAGAVVLGVIAIVTWLIRRGKPSASSSRAVESTSASGTTSCTACSSSPNSPPSSDKDGGTSSATPFGGTA